MRLPQDLRKEWISDAVLLGMGGSSLGAEVFAKTFGASPEWPALHVLDSTHPETIRAVEGRSICHERYSLFRANPEQPSNPIS